MKIAKSSLNGDINDFNFVKMDAKEVTYKEILDACLEVPFLDNKKVVVVEDAFFLSNAKSKMEDDPKGLIKYLKNPTDEVDLIFLVYSDKLNLKSSIYKALEDKVKQLSFTALKENDWSKYVTQIAKKKNIDIDPLAVKELSKRTLNDRDLLFNELDKLSLYKEHISLNDVISFVSEKIEDSAFSISNALLKGDTALALFSFYDLMKTKSIEPVVLLAMLSTQFRFLFKVKYLKDQGKTLEDIAHELKTSEIRCSISYKNAKAMKKDISVILDDLYNLEYKIKSGQIDHFLALELYISNFSKNYL